MTGSGLGYAKIFGADRGHDCDRVVDLKLINRSAKEMRSAAKIFTPFKHLRKVAVFGSARSADDSPNCKMATDFACEMVRQGFMLVAGGPLASADFHPDSQQIWPLPSVD